MDMKFALALLVALLLGLRGIVLKARSTRARHETRSGPVYWNDVFNGAPVQGARRPDIVVLSAIVEEAGQCVRYVGVLAAYCLDSGQGLDSLVLAAPQRSESPTQQPLDGVVEDYVVLRYAQVHSLSVRYVAFDPPPARDAVRALGGPEILAA